MDDDLLGIGGGGQIPSTKKVTFAEQTEKDKKAGLLLGDPLETYNTADVKQQIDPTTSDVFTEGLFPHEAKYAQSINIDKTLEKSDKLNSVKRKLNRFKKLQSILKKKLTPNDKLYKPVSINKILYDGEGGHMNPTKVLEAIQKASSLLSKDNMVVKRGNKLMLRTHVKDKNGNPVRHKLSEYKKKNKLMYELAKLIQIFNRFTTATKRVNMLNKVYANTEKDPSKARHRALKRVLAYRKKMLRNVAIAAGKVDKDGTILYNALEIGDFKRYAESLRSVGEVKLANRKEKDRLSLVDAEASMQANGLNNDLIQVKLNQMSLKQAERRSEMANRITKNFQAYATFINVDPNLKGVSFVNKPGILREQLKEGEKLIGGLKNTLVLDFESILTGNSQFFPFWLMNDIDKKRAEERGEDVGGGKSDNTAMLLMLTGKNNNKTNAMDNTKSFTVFSLLNNIISNSTNTVESVEKAVKAFLLHFLIQSNTNRGLGLTGDAAPFWLISALGAGMGDKGSELMNFLALKGITGKGGKANSMIPFMLLGEFDKQKGGGGSGNSTIDTLMLMLMGAKNINPLILSQMMNKENKNNDLMMFSLLTGGGKSSNIMETMALTNMMSSDKNKDGGGVFSDPIVTAAALGKGGSGNTIRKIAAVKMMSEIKPGDPNAMGKMLVTTSMLNKTTRRYRSKNNNLANAALASTVINQGTGGGESTGGTSNIVQAVALSEALKEGNEKTTKKKKGKKKKGKKDDDDDYMDEEDSPKGKKRKASGPLENIGEAMAMSSLLNTDSKDSSDKGLQTVLLMGGLSGGSKKMNLGGGKGLFKSQTLAAKMALGDGFKIDIPAMEFSNVKVENNFDTELIGKLQLLHKYNLELSKATTEQDREALAVQSKTTAKQFYYAAAKKIASAMVVMGARKKELVALMTARNLLRKALGYTEKQFNSSNIIGDIEKLLGYSVYSFLPPSCGLDKFLPTEIFGDGDWATSLTGESFETTDDRDLYYIKSINKNNQRIIRKLEEGAVQDPATDYAPKREPPPDGGSSGGGTFVSGPTSSSYQGGSGGGGASFQPQSGGGSANFSGSSTTMGLAGGNNPFNIDMKNEFDSTRRRSRRGSFTLEDNVVFRDRTRSPSPSIFSMGQQPVGGYTKKIFLFINNIYNMKYIVRNRDFTTYGTQDPLLLETQRRRQPLNYKPIKPLVEQEIIYPQTSIQNLGGGGLKVLEGLRLPPLTSYGQNYSTLEKFMTTTKTPMNDLLSPLMPKSANSQQLVPTSLATSGARFSAPLTTETMLQNSIMQQQKIQHDITLNNYKILETSKNQLKSSLDTLRREFDINKDTLLKYEQLINKLKSETGVKDNEIKSLVAQLRQYENQHIQLRQELSKHRALLDNVNQTRTSGNQKAVIDDLNKRISDSEILIGRLKEDQKNFNSVMNTLKQLYGRDIRTSQDIQNYVNEYNSLTSRKINDAEQKIANLEEALRLAQQKQIQLNSNNERLTNQITTISSENEVINSRNIQTISKLTTEINDLTSRISNIDNENSVLKTAIRRAEEQARSLELSNQFSTERYKIAENNTLALEAENKRLTNYTQALQSEINTLLGNLQSVKEMSSETMNKDAETLNILKREYDNLTLMYQTVERENTMLRQETLDIQNRYEQTARSAINKKKTKIQQIKLAIERMIGRSVMTEGSKGRSQAIINALNDFIISKQKEADTQIYSLNQDLVVSQQKLANEMQNVTKMSGEISALKQELDGARSTISRQESSIQVISGTNLKNYEEVKRLGIENDRYKNEISELNKRLQTIQYQIDVLASDVARKQAELDRTNSQLEKARSDYSSLSKRASEFSSKSQQELTSRISLFSQRITELEAKIRADQLIINEYRNLQNNLKQVAQGLASEGFNDWDRIRSALMPYFTGDNSAFMIFFDSFMNSLTGLQNALGAKTEESEKKISEFATRVTALELEKQNIASQNMDRINEITIEYDKKIEQIAAKFSEDYSALQLEHQNYVNSILLDKETKEREFLETLKNLKDNNEALSLSNNELKNMVDKQTTSYNFVEAVQKAQEEKIAVLNNMLENTQSAVIANVINNEERASQERLEINQQVQGIIQQYVGQINTLSKQLEKAKSVSLVKRLEVTRIIESIDPITKKLISKTVKTMRKQAKTISKPESFKIAKNIQKLTNEAYTKTGKTKGMLAIEPKRPRQRPLRPLKKQQTDEKPIAMGDYTSTQGSYTTPQGSYTTPLGDYLTPMEERNLNVSPGLAFTIRNHQQNRLGDEKIAQVISDFQTYAGELNKNPKAMAYIAEKMRPQVKDKLNLESTPGSMESLINQQNNNELEIQMGKRQAFY